MRLRLLDDDAPPRGLHGPARDGGRTSLTVVAEDGGTVAGMGTIRLMELHRDRYYAQIDVEPRFRRQGVGRALFGELQRRKPEPFRLLGRAMSSRPERLAFARAVGFTVLARCPSPQVDPGSAAARDWAARRQTADGVRLVAAAELPVDDLLDAWARYYAQAHEPLAPVRSPETVRATLARTQLPGVDLDASRVAVRAGGRVAGIALLSPDAWDGRTFALCETTDRDEPDGDRITGCLVAGLLTSAAARGLPLVEFEGQDTDAHIAVVESLPAVGSDPLLLLTTAD